VKEYKTIKAVYMTMQEDNLYQKWEITETNGRSESDHSFEAAFVTFRSMHGKNKAM
jgi:hypothetical protein